MNPVTIVTIVTIPERIEAPGESLRLYDCNDSIVTSIHPRNDYLSRFRAQSLHPLHPLRPRPLGERKGGYAEFRSKREIDPP